MKKSLLTLAGAIVAIPLVFPAPIKSVRTIPATLAWILSTNWTQEFASVTANLGPTTTTYHESGFIQSNLVATVEWKGQSFSVPLEQVHVGIVNRNYTLESRRLYK